MRFDTTPHHFYCGIDLHARAMSVCIVSHDGESVLHRHMTAAPEAFLTAVAPSREGLVVAAECIFTWSWLADLCAEQGLPCVLGHALSMKASHGGTATHAQIDAHKIAALLRGGMLPQAAVYPAQMRAPRDLLRRRTHRMRTRAERLAHGQQTNSPYNLPAIGQQMADKANREGVAERFHDPAVQKSLAVDLALITSDDALLKDLERSLRNTAKQHDATTLDRLPTVPGMGKILSLVLRYEIHQIDRFPRVPDFASYARLVKCSKDSGGTRLGTSGKKIGHAHLQWAFSEAATRCLRNNPQGQKLLSRLENKHDQGKALRIRAHKLGRARYDMLRRKTAFDRDLFLRSYGSRAGEPGASLDASGDEPASRTPAVRLGCGFARPGVQRTRLPELLRLMGHPRWLQHMRRLLAQGARARPLSRT